MHQTFEQEALKASTSYQKVQRAKLSDTFPGVLYYLYWRNRYPVLTRVLTRVLLLIELFAVYSLFSTGAAASLSIVIFSAFLAKGLFQGVSQFFRIKIIEAEQRKALLTVSNLNKASQIAALGYSLFIVIISTAAVLSIDASATTITFASAWILIFPIQLSSSMYWMSVYTRRRLRRSFWVIIFLRLLPLISLLLLSSTIDIYSYPLGLLIGRGLEQWYLRNLAKQELKLSGSLIDGQDASIKKTLKIISELKLFKHFTSNAGFYLFQLAVGFALYARAYEQWFIHFSLFFVIATFSFIPLRIPISLGFDIYQALRIGSTLRASRLVKIVRAGSLIILAALIAASTALLLFHTAVFVIGAGAVYGLFIYFIGLMTVRSWYLMEFSLLRTANLEAGAGSLFASTLLLSAALLEVVLIINYRANLPMIYLVEILVFALASIILMLQLRFEKSDIFNRALFLREENKTSLPLAAWNSAVKAGSSPAFLILQLDNRYRSEARTQTLLKLVDERVKVDILFARIAPTIYAVCVPQAALDAAAGTIYDHFSGQVRNVIKIDKSKSALKNLRVILNAVNKVRDLPKKVRTYHSMFSRILKTTSEQELAGLSTQLNPSPENLIKFLELSLSEKISAVLFDGSRLKAKGKVSLDCLRTAHRACLSAEGPYSMIPILNSPTASLHWGTECLAVIDTKSLNEKNINKLYQLILLISLVSASKFLLDENRFKQAA